MEQNLEYRRFEYYLENRRISYKIIHEAEREMWESLKKSRRIFSKKEYAVMKLRYHENFDLDRIGKNLGVTRERVRQILDYSMAKWKSYQPLKPS